MSVTAIVMAAGASERMGRTKLLLPFRTGTVLDTTIAAVTAAPVDRIVVVTGADAEAVEASINATGVAIVPNPDHRRGNMSSLLAATDADRTADAFIQVPGDTPLVQPDTISALVDRWNERRPWAAVTAYRDRIAHPFLLSRACIDAAKEIDGPKVLWKVLVTSGDDRVERVTHDADAPLDVNTPGDYERLLAVD